MLFRYILGIWLVVNTAILHMQGDNIGSLLMAVVAVVVLGQILRESI